ncbi:phosphatidate cytidylyltransferase [Acidibrevibacterium fodinaquatile]|uniref:phosphatidate cytidylyltransferase n=1 Tax=Acidibrevibacterium fodinaquatile TaxID=1969806 RepID=UPI000E0DD362|nr:phosphatidate cytidylyltransferase [Acidibrevibacterium fodinaquatile]
MPARPDRPAGRERAAGPWGDLGIRVLSAAVLVPLALAAIWFGAIPFVALVGLGAVGLGAEWVMLCHESWRHPAGWLVIASLALTVPAAGDVSAASGLAVALVGAALTFLWRRRCLAGGLVYIALAMVALVWLRADQAAGRGNTLFLMLTVWASDVGAYLAGRLIGGAKLAPLISPGKTWSGAAGGLVAAIAIGAGAAGLGGGTWWHGALVAALLGVIAQGGDLFESFLKRRFGVKDSSHLIPGHGGLLDRLDGVLTAAPMAAALALILGRGVLLWM